MIKHEFSPDLNIKLLYIDFIKKLLYIDNLCSVNSIYNFILMQY